MSDNIKGTKLTVNSQYIKDLSFENPNSPESLSNKDGLPQIDVDINVVAKPLIERLYEVSLSINGRAKKNNLKIFEVELAYAGLFTLPDVKFKNNIEKKIMLIEAPQLLFPYARSIVSNVTRDGGFMPLIIQPIDFELLYESRMKKEKH
jgi:preprotein translocase subunit SecB